MRADTIAPGDVLLDPATGSVVYTVLDTRPLDGEIVVGVRYEVDGGTGCRYFTPDQNVPLVRLPLPTEAVSGLTPGGSCRP